MLSFKPIQIEDKETITAFTYPNNLLNCDYAFANMCSWRFLYKSEYAIHDRFLYVRFYFKANEHEHLAYMFPVGDGDLKQAIDRMKSDAESLGHVLLLLGVTPDAKVALDKLLPNVFSFSMERNYYDYIYLHEDLISLKGKKYQSKRNHINKFKKQYDYTYLPFTKEIIPDCIALENVWYEAHKVGVDDERLSHERRSMRFAMEHSSELGLLGGALVVDNKIIAFTYGSPINNKIFNIHVEKADIRYEGAFSVINQEFTKQIPQQYVFINREEDLGIPGLRKSKLSYHPHLLLEKNSAIMRGR